jgi:Cdc6-like AAA superfamily ATPase
MSKKIKTWQDLEVLVRIIASNLYNCAAESKTIKGIRCDAVLEKEIDNIILIEISKSNSLEKIRTDLAKFANLKSYYNMKNIYAKCIFICETELHPSIVETAKGLFVEALSIYQFAEKLFNFQNYLYARNQKNFGSAVDPITGNNDTSKYIPVKYHSPNFGDLSIDAIADMLLDGKYIVLLGEYGSGKSRCLKELFSKLAEKFKNYYKYPIHINLKENWGLKRSYEVLYRHINDLGLSKDVDSFIKISDKTSVCYLLDGFDEVGAQTWSDTPEKLKDIRRKSLSGIKDIIINSKGGAIISGREHYFKSDEELIDCLGLDKKNPIFIKCKSEFSVEEAISYLGSRTNIFKFPDWLPKKPLICQIIGGIDISDLSLLFKDNVAEFDFFNLFLEIICERETRINNALDKDIIRGVLLAASILVREKENRYGPITINELNNIFENITGSTVADETAIILQRLPGLGRIDGNSHDRQFIDEYILSGLQAISLIDIINSNNMTAVKKTWNNLPSEWSIRYVAASFDNTNSRNNAVSYFNNNINCVNKYIIGDILSALSVVDHGCIDFGNRKLNKINCLILDLTNNSIKNLSIDDGYINKLLIEDTDVYGITIKNACIDSVEGISSEDGCPNWLQGNLIESFQEINNLSQIKRTKLSNVQRIFIIITRKLFMQPGAGRKETALFKGYDSSEQKKLVNKIMQVLGQNNFYEVIPGNEGKVYVPNRKMNARIQAIHSELLLSKDEIWLQISKIDR